MIEQTEEAPDTAVPDMLVPDKQVRREMGDISEMSMSRWDRDPRMAAQGWPAPVKIRGHKFRSRRQLEIFKQNMLVEALKTRKAVTDAATRKNQTTGGRA